MNDSLVRLFKTLDTFVKVNVCADWESLHEDYTFVLESTSPSAAALALDCARANTINCLWLRRRLKTMVVLSELRVVG
jgi:hypothetical protein